LRWNAIGLYFDDHAVERAACPELKAGTGAM
jgi:hypothetical protein